VQFEKVTLLFQLENSPTAEKYLPETMAGGVAAFDFDNDGRPDLFFANGAELPMTQKSSGKYWNRLLRNDRDGKFTDVTENSGLRGEILSIGTRRETTTTTAGGISS
jgi:hypothetical protein